MFNLTQGDKAGEQTSVEDDVVKDETLIEDEALTEDEMIIEDEPLLPDWPYTRLASIALNFAR